MLVPLSEGFKGELAHPFTIQQLLPCSLLVSPISVRSRNFDCREDGLHVPAASSAVGDHVASASVTIVCLVSLEVDCTQKVRLRARSRAIDRARPLPDKHVI